MTEVSYGHVISFIDQSGVKSARSVPESPEMGWDPFPAPLRPRLTLRAGLFYPDKQNLNDFIRCHVVLWEV